MGPITHLDWKSEPRLNVAHKLPGAAGSWLLPPHKWPALDYVRLCLPWLQLALRPKYFNAIYPQLRSYQSPLKWHRQQPLRGPCAFASAAQYQLAQLPGHRTQFAYLASGMESARSQLNLCSLPNKHHSPAPLRLIEPEPSDIRRLSGQIHLHTSFTFFIRPRGWDERMHMHSLTHRTFVLAH